jgi:hypothetical protein
VWTKTFPTKTQLSCLSIGAKMSLIILPNEPVLISLPDIFLSSKTDSHSVGRLLAEESPFKYQSSNRCNELQLDEDAAFWFTPQFGSAELSSNK